MKETNSQSATRRAARLAALFVSFLFASGIVFASGAKESASAQQSSAVTINFYTGGDVNVHDLWANDILPAYKKVAPNVNVNLVFSEHNGSDQLVFDKIAAAKQAGKVSGVDIWETGRVLQAGEAGLAMKVSATDIANLSRVSPDVLAQAGGYGVPYRGSSVVIAYNSQYVSNPPTTLQGLFDWIKQNPGKFTYNPPDTGGSGDAFVQAVLKTSVNSSDLKTFQTSYNQSLESEWGAGWKLLESLGPDVYQGGFYPKGNVGVLQLLDKGAIWLAPVWSDMGLSYLAQGLLPANVKLEQLDPPFSGGASYIAVVSDSLHKSADDAFLNWLLTPEVQAIVIHKMNGYPGVEWQYVPADVRQKFAAIAKNYSFGFSAKFDSDMHQMWYQNVANAGKN